MVVWGGISFVMIAINFGADFKFEAKNLLYLT